MDRLPNSNILFIGGYANVAVLFFDGKGFDVLGRIGEGDPFDPMVDLKFIGKKLYFMNQPTRQIFRADFDTNDADSTANFSSNPHNDYKTKSLADKFRSIATSSLRIPSNIFD